MGELEVDWGPKPTSKRGSAPGLERLQSNIPEFLANYVTLIFFFMQLHELTHFGILVWVWVLQCALMLVPSEALPKLTPSMRVRLLQVVHLVLWLLYVRALWL